MWENYGDINYFEHGGCQVKPTWTQKNIKKYPSLASEFDVFYLIRDNDKPLAALCTVDVNDSWIDKTEVLTAIGLEDSGEKYGGLTPQRFAAELVEYYGIQEFNPIFFENSFELKEKDLKYWLRALGIKEKE